MVKTKPSLPPEGNEQNNSTDKNKGQATKYKKYRGKKTQTKYQGLDPKSDTDLKGRYSDLEDNISTFARDPRTSSLE